MAQPLTLTLTAKQVVALEYVLRVAHDMADDSDLASVKRDDRTLAALRIRLGEVL